MEKAHHLSTFMSEGTEEYNPRILVATSGATNAGIDSNKIYCVVRLVMPSSRVDIAQEQIRSGQFDGANPSLCSYTVNISISMKSFEYQFCQTLSKHNVVLDNLYREEMRIELMETLKLLTIAPKCIAQELEEAMANLNSDINTESQPCGNCFICKGSCHGKPFWSQGIEMLLFSVLGMKEGIEGETTTDNITTEIWK